MLSNKSLGLTASDLSGLRDRFAASLFNKSAVRELGEVLELAELKIKAGQQFYVIDLAYNRPRKLTFYAMFTDDSGKVAIMRGKGFESHTNFLKRLLSRAVVPTQAFYLTYDDALDGLKEHHEQALKAIETLRTCKHS